MDQSGIHSNYNMDDIEQSVIEFLKTINNLSKTPQNLEELSDGIVLTELLSKINDSIFDVDQVERDTQDNWALNHRNIKRLIDSIEHYYHDILKLKDFDKDTYLDASEISRNKNKNEIVKLVELVLGIIVQSEQKSDFIHAITQLEKKYQAVLMHLMEKWIVQDRLHTDGDDNASMESMSSQRFNSASIQYNTQSYYYQQNQQLLKKIDELERENDVLNEKIEELRTEQIEKDRKILEYEKDFNKKDDEMKKLKLSRDSMMISLGMSTNEDIESVVKTKDLKIEQLNQTIVAVQQQAQLEKDKLNDEISLLNKKLKQLQKISESLDFYKQKYDEYTQLSEKFSEADKKAKQFDKNLQDKDSQIEMLMEKLQEFKQSYNEEKKKSMEKAIEISQRDNQIEQLRREVDQVQRKYQLQEEKLQDMSQILERYQQDESQSHSDYKKSSNQVSAKKVNDGPKGLSEDLNQIINDLERENILLKSEQTTLDPSVIHLEDASSLKEQINLLQTKLTEQIKIQHELESKLSVYEKCDVEKLKEENEKLKNDYQNLLAKSLKRKERREEEQEETLRSLQEEITRRESEIQQYQEKYQDQNSKILQLNSEKARLADEWEKKVNDLQKQIANYNQQISQLQNQIDQKDKKLDQQKQQYTNLFQNKQEELDILFGVLCEMRLKYQQIQSQEKTNCC
ncbi:hook-like protein (macronuclear) [Tetrahymena thermophila SB210]|uniref:Hook-like protein n=1 Tax=Tetrahymena thermophila (strain SB210) TaxID=312017 RepID=A4VDS8_TETTS|nr:hook-like protein [Tetrahymena thermophila SB210]EDK31697.2 hook-like protein [Tetrahymena thermophila SB210]|eukprot:XP_001470825.2 hook-like protein [Tetrahymena thermophila SB210]